jgi:hypothetical protein
MYIVGMTLRDVYALFPPGGVGAEVGVKRGNNARAMFAATVPSKLHLIDPWGKDTDHAYSAHEAQATMQGYYEAVAKWSALPENGGRIEVVRDYSTVAATRFPEGYFDWVYIDGLHDYENVYADLSAFLPKIKPGGFLFGDDYWDLSVNPNKKKKSNLPQDVALGMINGVNDFCDRFGQELLFVTSDESPKFFLARKGEATSSREILRKALAAAPFVVEVENPRSMRTAIAHTAGADPMQSRRVVVKVADVR